MARPATVLPACARSKSRRAAARGLSTRRASSALLAVPAYSVNTTSRSVCPLASAPGVTMISDRRSRTRAGRLRSLARCIFTRRVYSSRYRSKTEGVAVSLNLAQHFDRYPLAYLPSPLHPLRRLSKELGLEVWAKRDDVSSGLAFGGNKVRKLEWLLPDAIRQGCDTLVSIGGVQSNHTRQVAAVAARLGLGCVLVQEHWVDWPDAVYDKVGNILLSRIMGAEVRLDPAGFDIGLRPSWEQALADVEAGGGKPYAIPAGASDHPLGGHGFARWATEVAEQERELGVFFDTIVVCSVTGSTQAGMVAGFALQDVERRVLGIDGSATVEQTQEQVAGSHDRP